MDLTVTVQYKSYSEFSKMTNNAILLHMVNVRGKAKGFPNKPPKGRKKGVLWLRRR